MRSAVLVVAFMVVAAPALGQVYKCTEGGKVVFSDYPCQRTGSRMIDVLPATGGPVNRSSEYWEAQEKAQREFEDAERRKAEARDLASRKAEQAARQAEEAALQRAISEEKARRAAQGNSAWAVAREIEVGKRAVLAALKDPDSAVFRGVRRGQLAICGEVNSRNGFGGYTGYTRFISSVTLVVFESWMTPSEFEKTWATAC